MNIAKEREYRKYGDKFLKDIPDSNLLFLIGAAISLNKRNIADDATQALLLEVEYRYDNRKLSFGSVSAEERIASLQAELNDKQREIESLRRELFSYRQQNESPQNPTPKCQNPFDVSMKVTGFNVH